MSRVGLSAMRFGLVVAAAMFTLVVLPTSPAFANPACTADIAESNQSPSSVTLTITPHSSNDLLCGIVTVDVVYLLRPPVTGIQPDDKVAQFLNVVAGQAYAAVVPLRLTDDNWIQVYYGADLPWTTILSHASTPAPSPPAPSVSVKPKPLAVQSQAPAVPTTHPLPAEVAATVSAPTPDPATASVGPTSSHEPAMVGRTPEPAAATAVSAPKLGLAANNGRSDIAVTAAGLFGLIALLGSFIWGSRRFRNGR